MLTVSCSILKILHKNKVIPEPHGVIMAMLIFVSIALSTSLHCESTNSGLSTFIIHRMPDFYTQFLLVLIAPTHGFMARLIWPGRLVK